ncbi:hypothetical protein EVAR_30640_1 [Eumeta japonica]|uniref:Mariner Mos1 transposase n=1 Tax=Eumeta variegata TaxID=151549 RepID=A0A4C1VS68_EUMVA|nr:hypothetical protein EVAR_30640_1 [Eumeta japonica]
MQNRHVTYREIKASLSISMTIIHKILHENLAAKKNYSRWIPYSLSIDQKRIVSIGAKNDKKYNHSALKAVNNIYTGDESWIYAYDPETKQQSTVWVPNPTFQKYFEGNGCLFFGINGHVVIVPLKNRKTVNSEWCTTIYLPEVFEEIRKNNRQC